MVREALVRLVGDGLADRLTNRGFAVPTPSDQRWQDIAEARRTLEPATLRLAIARGDLDWEARVRAAHHRLTRTPAYQPPESRQVDPEWSRAHHAFHRTLLEGSGNTVLLETFDRLWLASELARQWSTHRAPRARLHQRAPTAPSARCWSARRYFEALSAIHRLSK